MDDARARCLTLYPVIHRDIQPCNIVVSGGAMDDDLWWSDDLDVDGKVSNMARRTRIKLVDFGFARALCPKDVDADVGLRKISDERRWSAVDAASFEGGDLGEGVFVGSHPSCCSIDQALEDTTSHGGLKGGRSGGSNADDSISRRSVLDLSEFFFSISSRRPILHPPPRPFVPPSLEGNYT